MKLSIIIVNWNARELVLKCLKSIQEYVIGLDYEVILVDNASKDGSADAIEIEFPWVKLIKNQENSGFSIGNNIALKFATGEYILYLNPDTEMIENFDKNRFRVFDDESVGIVGCKQLNTDGSHQKSAARFPSPSVSFWGNYAIQDRDLTANSTVVDWVMGAYMLLKRADAVAVGGFNEEYFMYSEDMELCYKISKKCLYDPSFSIIHHYNQSGKLLWNNKREVKVLGSLLKFVLDHYVGLKKYFTIVAIYMRFFVKKVVSKNA